MAAHKIKKSRCAECPHRFTYSEVISRREGGVNLHFGREYCRGGKKYHAFKKSDPKTYPPDWCPRLKSPCEFRVYTFKNTNSWYLHNLLHKDATPDAYQCAVRLSGTVALSPNAFFSMLEEKDVSELLGVEVHSGEIVEIDDGLNPCCFFIKYGEARYLPYWNAETARRNKYQGDAKED